ncbi:hypothetical protein PMSD_21295 [Paenibacillus macquariensis subsp. defensor]|nr:hypothetical protein PMSD_21295 [Paenibacillus macquariensis subsp. defensor]
MDHLDSWVRSAQITGLLKSSTELLARLELDGNYISTDAETAETLLQFIISEAKFHCSGENMGPSAILKYLVTQLIEQNVVSVETISEMTDASLESLLLRCELTQEEARRLFYSPHEIIVTRTQPKVSSNPHVVALNKLYLSEPLITNERVPINALTSYTILGELSSVLGTYYVYWDE